MTTLSTRVISSFNASIEKYERTNLTDLLSGTNISPQKFKQMLINELERNVRLQEVFIKKNKKNLTRYLYLENIKGKILFLDFQKIVEEIQRMGVEIHYLEEKRLEYFKIQEKQQKL
jgi:hypothetical protein